MKTEIFSRYKLPPSPQFVTPKDELSKSIQSVYPETTVKYHIDRFMRTGIWGDPISTAKMRYLDVSHYPSFEAVQNKLSYAKSLFESLSPADRQSFESEASFIDYLTDEGKRDEALWQEAQKILASEGDGDLFAKADSYYTDLAEGEKPAEGGENSEPKEAARDAVPNDSTAA